MSEARQLTERLIDVWNNKDKQTWLASTADDAKVGSTGGFTASGKAGAEQFYTMWNGAFPDNQVTARRIVAEGEVAIFEGTFSGTHTGVLQSPSGSIPPTGKKVKTEFVNAITYSGGKIVASHVYFDQIELLTQLGVLAVPAPAAAR